MSDSSSDRGRRKTVGDFGSGSGRRPESGFRGRVEAVVAALAPGEVVTYGEVAAQAGSPGAARAVGGVLRTSDAELPWWRVVGAGGVLVAPSAERQARLLAAEGVPLVGRRVKPTHLAGHDPGHPGAPGS